MSPQEQIIALKQWMLHNEHPNAVFQSAIRALEHSGTDAASFILWQDSDKFSMPRGKTIRFLHSIGLVNDNWKKILNTWSFKKNPLL